MEPQNPDCQRIFIITGDLAAGKTSLLRQLAERLSPRYQLTGVINPATRRPHRAGRPANFYEFELLPGGKRLPWAQHLGNGFSFNHDSLERVIAELRKNSVGAAEIMLIDDIGPLELEGSGFDGIIKKNRTDGGPILIMAVKKRCLKEIMERYGLAGEALVLDLDQIIDSEQICERIIRCLEDGDSRHIAAFAVLCGLTEVGLGSILHSLNLPFKGHFLSLLQIMMLTIAGRRLNGRGLFQVAGITAMLKSFSPAGPKLKPMFFIFTQGAFFALPSSIFGWGLLTALGGAALSSSLMLLMALGSAYLQYGSAYFTTLENIFDKILNYLSLPTAGLPTYLLTFFALKILLCLSLVAMAYFANLRFFEKKLLAAQSASSLDKAVGQPDRQRNWLNSSLRALRDLLRLRVLFPLALTSTAIIYFTKPGAAESGLLLLRAALVTWLGFMLIHRINPLSVVEFFRRRGSRGFATTLDHSLTAWQNQRKS